MSFRMLGLCLGICLYTLSLAQDLSYNPTIKNTQRQGWLAASPTLGFTAFPGTFVFGAQGDYFLREALSLGLSADAGISDHFLLYDLEATAKLYIPIPEDAEWAKRLLPFFRLGAGAIIIKDEKQLDPWAKGALLSPGIGADYILNDFFAVTAAARIITFTKVHGERICAHAATGVKFLF